MEHVSALNQEDIGSCAYVATSYLIDAWRFSHGDHDYAFRTSETKLVVDAAVLGEDSALGDLSHSIALHRRAPNWVSADFASEGRTEFRHETDRSVAKDVTLGAYREFGSFSRADENRLMGGWTDEVQEGTVTRGLRLASLFQLAKDSNSAEGYRGLKALAGAVGSDFKMLVVAPGARTEMDFDPLTLEFGIELAPFNVAAQIQWMYMAKIPQKAPRTFVSRGRIFEKPSQYIDFVEAYFESRQADVIQPLRFGYCAHVLQAPYYRGVKVERESDGNGIRTFLDGDCGPHAGVVLGRRVVDGTLEFLLQDTNGPESRSIWPSEKGQYWIEAKDLAANTFFLNYFSDGAL